jgi:hypothetical protein
LGEWEQARAMRCLCETRSNRFGKGTREQTHEVSTRGNTCTKGQRRPTVIFGGTKKGDRAGSLKQIQAILVHTRRRDSERCSVCIVGPYGVYVTLSNLSDYAADLAHAPRLCNTKSTHDTMFRYQYSPSGRTYYLA